MQTCTVNTRMSTSLSQICLYMVKADRQEHRQQWQETRLLRLLWWKVWGGINSIVELLKTVWLAKVVGSCLIEAWILEDSCLSVINSRIIGIKYEYICINILLAICSSCRRGVAMVIRLIIVWALFSDWRVIVDTWDSSVLQRSIVSMKIRSIDLRSSLHWFAIPFLLYKPAERCCFKRTLTVHLTV